MYKWNPLNAFGHGLKMIMLFVWAVSTMVSWAAKKIWRTISPVVMDRRFLWTMAVTGGLLVGLDSVFDAELHEYTEEGGPGIDSYDGNVFVDHGLNQTFGSLMFTGGTFGLIYRMNDLNRTVLKQASLNPNSDSAWLVGGKTGTALIALMFLGLAAFSIGSLGYACTEAGSLSLALSWVVPSICFLASAFAFTVFLCADTPETKIKHFNEDNVEKRKHFPNKVETKPVQSHGTEQPDAKKPTIASKKPEPSKGKPEKKPSPAPAKQPAPASQKEQPAELELKPVTGTGTHIRRRLKKTPLSKLFHEAA